MATTDKYDRQLRLWGASGQRSLSNTLVVLIGSSACGTETLKNLVLPGVGSFLVIDDDGASPTSTSSDSSFSTHSSPELTPSLLKFSSHSSNFFLSPQSTDQDGITDKLSKAARASALLSELNPDVSGFYFNASSLQHIDYASLLKYLRENPPSLGSESSSPPSSNKAHRSKILVIAVDQPSPVILPLSLACHNNSIPLLTVRSYGLLGSVRIQTASPYHCIVEAKPSHRIPDLRLSSWPLFDGLKNILSTVPDLDDMEDSKEHSHVPFVFILLQALDKWRQTVSAPFNPDPSLRPRYPESFQEKEAFRKLVRGMAKNLNNEMNFEEAIREAHLVWADGRVSEDVKMVLEQVVEEDFFNAAVQSDMEVSDTPSASKVPAHVLQFQLLVLALKRFLKHNDDYPPLEGTIPDMTSDTTRYVALQEVYEEQSKEDRKKFQNIINEIMDECRQKANGCDLFISMPSDDEIVTFCKNARHIRILETRPIFGEYQRQDPDSPTVCGLSKSISAAISKAPNFERIHGDSRDDLLSATYDPYETEPIHTPFLWWVALRACDAFYDRHQHYPGKDDRELALEADSSEVYKHMLEISSNLGLTQESDFIKETIFERGRDLAKEVVRYDEAEIHSIAAILGGVASQEAVKLVTGQYVPFDDTYVYNGIASTAGVYRF